MGEYAGLIEMIFFYSIAIGFGVWQWWKMKSELKRDRAARAEREAKERSETKAATPSEVSSYGPSPGASDKAA